MVGDGRARLVASTMSGDVHIVKARRDARRARSGPSAGPREPAPAASASDAAIAAAYDEARLRILRSVERGEIDVAEAGRRLEALDAAGIGEDATRE